MVNISKFGDSAIKFTFTDNYRYLHNGEIEVPLNSLILVVDESDMVTFKKIDGDPFVSFLISDSNFESKETLIYFYKTSMVGSTGGGSESGITSGDVQTMIDTSLEDYYDIDEIDAALSGKADSSAVTEAITAAVSGKADSSAVTESINAAVSGKADTSAVTEEISAAVSGKADSTAVTQEISAAISGKADASDVETALSAKQDISGMTAYTTSSDVESYVSGFTYDKATIDSKVASGGTFDPTNYYDKTATDALLDNKFDASAFTSYSAATDARISEDEEVTAAALNALNDGKQDTLIAGSGITISGNVISAEGGNLVIELTQAEYDALVDKDPNAFYIITDATEINISDYYTSAQTQSAINAAVSGKQDTLISGTNIKTINNISILGSGNIDIQGGGGGVTVVQTTGTSTTDVMSQDAVTNAFNTYTARGDNDEGITRFWAWKTPNHPYGDKYIYNFSINGKLPLSKQTRNTDYNNIFNFHLVETSAITSSVTSASTDSQVPSAKAVYDALQESGGGGVSESAFTSYSAATDARMSEDEEVTAAALNALNDRFDGLRLKKLTQSEYEALTVKDNNTLYILVG